MNDLFINSVGENTWTGWWGKGRRCILRNGELVWPEWRQCLDDSEESRILGVLFEGRGRSDSNPERRLSGSGHESYVRRSLGSGNHQSALGEALTESHRHLPVEWGLVEGQGLERKGERTIDRVLLWAKEEKMRLCSKVIAMRIKTNAI